MFRSFYARIAAVFLLLLLVLGAALAVWTAQGALRLTEAADQAINRDLAVELAPRFQPHLETDIDTRAIAEIIEGLTAVNRRINVFLLGSEGMIKEAFVEPGAAVEMAVVDTAPLDRLLAGEADLPVLGDDPLGSGRRRPFSVAPLRIMGEEGCYLYITLGSDAYDAALATMREAFFVPGALRGLALAFLLTAVAGLLLFGLLTRRLRRMTAVVEDFERGRLDRRVAVASGDEVGRLGASFNRMADALAANIGALERNDRLRRELVANVSHDLRSPLASIQGYLETVLLQHESLAPAERERYLEVVLRNTRRLTALVEELFELSRLDAEQVRPEVEAFSAAELVQDVAAQFEPQAAQAGVRLRTRLPDDLPPVYADIGLIERVIANLTDNALRHTPAGGEVELEPFRENGRVAVRVSDTGCGIAPEEQGRVFDRFYRGEAARTWSEGEGSGLGLAIARKILDLHGCSIRVESEPGRGATFLFDLPTAPETAGNGTGRGIC